MIFGSEGYLGSMMVDFFLQKNYIVYGFDNHIYKQKKLKSKKNYFFMNCDIRKPNKILKIINQKSIENILLLGGLVGDPIVKKYPKLANEVNLVSIKKFIKNLNTFFFWKVNLCFYLFKLWSFEI